MWHDLERGYSLCGIVVHVRPAAGDDYPIREPRLFLFAQLFGTPGEYTVRIDLVRIDVTEDGDEAEGEPIEHGPWDILLTGEDFVESFGFPFSRVPFPGPGVYEFQLCVDGFEGPLARERVEARS